MTTMALHTHTHTHTHLLSAFFACENFFALAALRLVGVGALNLILKERKLENKGTNCKRPDITGQRTRYTSMAVEHEAKTALKTKIKSNILEVFVGAHLLYDICFARSHTPA